MQHNFKVNDIIRTPDNEILQIIELDGIHGIQHKLSNGAMCFNGFLNVCELWEPKEGDWCWFCEDPENFPLDFVLDKFLRKTSFNEYITYYSGESYEYCFPFVGELPMKVNK